MFCKKGVPINFAKLIGKHLCQGFFFNKSAGFCVGVFFNRVAGLEVLRQINLDILKTITSSLASEMFTVKLKKNYWFSCRE